MEYETSFMNMLAKGKKAVIAAVFLLAFLWLWGTLPARAADSPWLSDYSYTLDQEKGLIRLDQYTGSAAEVTVPSKATIQDVEYTVYLEGGADRKLWYDTGVKSISFEPGIRLADDLSYLFYNCPEITALDLSNWDTSNVTNMAGLFGFCGGLTSLNISGFQTSSLTDMSGMFECCKGLTSLDLSGFDTSNVTTMASLFSGCKNLTSLNLSGLDTGKVTSMVSMFDSCSSLTELDLGSFNTSQVTDMESLFNGCSSLTELDLSGFDASNVENLKGMFRDCKNLASLTFGNFNPSRAESMWEMFRNCASLTSLDLSSFDTSSVNFMDSMFNGCSSLTSLDLSNFNTSNVKTMSSMFNACTNLKALDLSNFDTSKVTQLSWMFRYCSSLESVNVSSFDTSAATSLSQMFRGCSSLTRLDLSNFNTSNNTCLSFLFDGCSKLTSVDLSSFDTSKVTTMESMFNGCSSLKALDLSNFNTSQVTNMSWMFRNCAALESLDVSNFDTSEVVDMSQVFNGCSSLKSLDLSNFTTPKITTLDSVFRACSSLEDLDISHFDTANVTRMDGMFSGCGKLKTLDLSHFDTSKVTLMNSMFKNCSSLESLNVSSFDTAKVTTMKTMFSTCSALTSLDLSSFDTRHVTDVEKMFESCTALKTIRVSAFKNNGPKLPGVFHDDQFHFYTSIPDDIPSGTLLTKGQVNPSKAQVTVEDQTYTGSPIKAPVKVSIDGNTVPASHYRLSYSNNTNAGTAKVKVTFSYEFLDFQKEYPFIIKPCDASKAVITAADQEYTGEALTPAVKVVLDGKELPAESYTVSYKNNINPGKGLVTVKFKGNYSGTATKTFAIKGTLLGIVEKGGDSLPEGTGKHEYLPVKKTTTLKVKKKGVHIVRTRWSLGKKSRKYAGINRKSGKLKINKKGLGKKIIVYADVYYTRTAGNSGRGSQLSGQAVSGLARTEHRRLKAVVMSFEKMSRVKINGGRTVKVNKKLQLRAKGTPARKHTRITKTFIWTSSNKCIARVSRNGGKVTGIKKGTVTITCKPGDKISKCKARVRITVK